MTNIYKIVNLINGKVYVGKTIRAIEIRFKGHLEGVKGRVNRYLYDSINHYGVENFKVELIEQCEREIEDEREKYWIKSLKSNNKEFGYNMTEGGDGGRTSINFKHSEETKRKISDKNKGRVRTEEEKQNLRNKNLGKKLSEETKLKMSKSHIGKKNIFKNPEERSRKQSLAMKGKPWTEARRNAQNNRNLK